MTSSNDFRPKWSDLERESHFATWSPDAEPQSSTPQSPEAYTLPPIGPPGDVAPGESEGRVVQDDAPEGTYAQGLVEGRRQGAEEERQRLEAPLAALEGFVQTFDAARGELLHDQERNLYGLAVALARHLTHRAIATDPSIVRELVEEALKLLPRATTTEVRMNPDDLALIKHRLPASQPGDSLQIHWVEDKVLERGSFLMEAPNRIIDGRTDVALRRLYEQLSYE